MPNPQTVKCFCCDLKIAAFWPDMESGGLSRPVISHPVSMVFKIYCPTCTHEIHTLLDYLKYQQPNFHPKLDLGNVTMNALEQPNRPTPGVSQFVQHNELFMSDLRKVLDNML